LQHRDTQETLAVLDRLDLDTDKPSDEEIAKAGASKSVTCAIYIQYVLASHPKLLEIFPSNPRTCKLRLEMGRFCPYSAEIPKKISPEINI
jgi:hypothetical protein